VHRQSPAVAHITEAAAVDSERDQEDPGHLLYTRYQAPADAGEKVGGREAPPQLGSTVDDDAGEGKPRTCKRTTPTTPPRQRRPEDPYLHAGTPIWGLAVWLRRRRAAAGRSKGLVSILETEIRCV
jgi:hypothetical protein